jgi:hypothetical protein
MLQEVDATTCTASPVPSSNPKTCSRALVQQNPFESSRPCQREILFQSVDVVSGERLAVLTPSAVVFFGDGITQTSKELSIGSIDGIR